MRTVVYGPDGRAVRSRARTDLGAIRKAYGRDVDTWSDPGLPLGYYQVVRRRHDIGGWDVLGTCHVNVD